jgi:hypothetical protein
VLAPLLSHTTARPRQAGTSLKSQAHGPAGGSRASPTGTSQRYATRLICHPGQVSGVYLQVGGYRTSALSRPSQRVTMMAVTGQSPVPLRHQITRSLTIGSRMPENFPLVPTTVSKRFQQS